MLNLIQEIDQLWEPVYPYLANHIQEIYGRKGGVILEIGPFCGVIYTLMAQGVGSKFMIGAFPPGMSSFFMTMINKKGPAGEDQCCSKPTNLLPVYKKIVSILLSFGGRSFFHPFFVLIIELSIGS